MFQNQYLCFLFILIIVNLHFITLDFYLYFKRKITLPWFLIADTPNPSMPGGGSGSNGTSGSTNLGMYIYANIPHYAQI